MPLGGGDGDIYKSQQADKRSKYRYLYPDFLVICYTKIKNAVHAQKPKRGIAPDINTDPEQDNALEAPPKQSSSSFSRLSNGHTAAVCMYMQICSFMRFIN